MSNISWRTKNWKIRYIAEINIEILKNVDTNFSGRNKHPKIMQIRNISWIDKNNEWALSWHESWRSLFPRVIRPCAIYHKQRENEIRVVKEKAIAVLLEPSILVILISQEFGT